MWDLLSACLLAFLGLVAYFDFLQTKKQKKDVLTRVKVWRDKLEKIPLYHVPEQELRFTLGIFEIGRPSRVTAITRSAIAILISSMALTIAWAGSHEGFRLDSEYLLFNLLFGAMNVGCTLLILRLTTTAILNRFSEVSYAGLAFVCWQAITLIGAIFFGSALVIILGTLIFLITWPFRGEMRPEILLNVAGTETFNVRQALFFHYDPNFDDPLGLYVGMGFTTSLLFWMRLAILLLFVFSWLVAPLTTRFVYLNLRSLAEAEKGVLTVAAVGLAAFVKGLQEVVKALGAQL